jgi:diketogulonate reductase-like aldo/keto reductase
MQIMIDSKLQIVSNQVQYSIIDRRPEVKIVPFCLKHNISLLAYGSLCGGLMSERYLGRMQSPSTAELNTLSLRKYKKMIDAWGGWNLFQELLSTLNRIAQKYYVSIANVATSYILAKSAVASVIIGVRLGIADHRNSNLRVFNFRLDKSDCDAIENMEYRGSCNFSGSQYLSYTALANVLGNAESLSINSIGHETACSNLKVQSVSDNSNKVNSLAVPSKARFAITQCRLQL